MTLELFDTNSFMCNDQYEWDRKLVNSTITNIFFNNEQSIKNANIWNDGIATFKARQTYKKWVKVNLRMQWLFHLCIYYDNYVWRLLIFL